VMADGGPEVNRMVRARSSNPWPITVIAASVCCLYLGQSSFAASVRGWGNQTVDSTEPGRKDFIAVSAGGGHTLALERVCRYVLADAVETMLNPDTLKNKNMKNALLNKINAVQQMLDAGRYEEALNKLQNDILQKTNGCAETGEPDKNNWIITCEGQSVLYPLVIETIEHVRGLMNQ
ncbi:unnamed protein product, partial [marine sediment metagenome]